MENNEFKRYTAMLRAIRSKPTVSLSDSDRFRLVSLLASTTIPGDRKKDLETRIDKVMDSSDAFESVVIAYNTPGVLAGWLEWQWGNVSESAAKRDRSRGRIYAWHAYYLIESALMAYEKTSNEDFLAYARDHLLEILSHRDDFKGRLDYGRNKVLRAWGTDSVKDGKPVKNANYTNIVTHAGRIAALMGWYSWLVRGGVTKGVSHEKAAAVLAKAALDAVSEFDSDFVIDCDGCGYYMRASSGGIEALNHQTSVGEAHVYIAELFDDELINQKRDALIKFIRQAMYEADNGTKVWNYAPKPGRPRAGRKEPIWKAQITVRFLWHAGRLGVGFSEAELCDIGQSISKNIFQSGGIEKLDEVNSVMSDEYLPLDRYDLCDRKGNMGSENVLPLILMADYDPSLAKTIPALVSNDSRKRGWLWQKKTAISYAYLLR